MLHLDRVVLAQDDFRLTADWEVAPGARVAIIGPSG
ncbi:MAG: thiamine ABC transporter ATP-binding protein, partial [Pseudomonadota bacterium]